MATAITGISQAELLEALAVAQKGPKEARTMAELARDYGVDIRLVRRALSALHEQGRLERHRITRERLNGTALTLVGFTVRPRPKRAKA